LVLNVLVALFDEKAPKLELYAKTVIYVPITSVCTFWSLLGLKIALKCNYASVAKIF